MSCPLRHTNVDQDGTWGRGNNEYVELLVAVDGTFQFRAVCRGCGTRSLPLPHKVAFRFGDIEAVGFSGSVRP